MLEISDYKLNEDTYHPYLDISFKTKLSLDPEMHISLARHDENVINILVSEYRYALENKLKMELEKYDLEKYL